MPITWNVQPYRWLYELRYQYTQAVIVTSRYELDEIAQEAQSWMKQNAPWKDRSQAERDKARSREGFPSARSQLRVRVLRNEAEDIAYKQGRSAAERKDATLLQRLNRERSAAATAERLASGPGPTSLVNRTKTQIARAGTYIPLRSVPSKMSAVAAFEKEWKGIRSPIGQLRFEHGRADIIPYAIWLEIAHQGRFNIIARSIEHWGPILMRRLTRIANFKQFKSRVGPVVESIRQEQAISPEQRFQDYVRKQGPDYQPFTRQVRETKARRRTSRRRSE